MTMRPPKGGIKNEMREKAMREVIERSDPRTIGRASRGCRRRTGRVQR